MPPRRRLGAEAEDAAAAYLLSLGYLIVTRRFKTKGGEIDIVALDGEEVVFVEVKSRRGSLRDAEASVNAEKIARLALAAQEYVEATGDSDRESRFDLISMGPEGISHHKDAWRP